MTTTRTIDPVESVVDRESDRRVLLLVSGLLLTAFAVGAAVQTVFVFRLEREGTFDPVEAGLDVGRRIGINLVGVAVVLALTAAVRLHERTAGVRMLCVAATAAVGAMLRFGAQVVTGVYSRPTWIIAATEQISVFVVIVTALALGVAQADARSRLRAQERLSAGQALRAAEALEALASEELRVRRDVAANLHGTVQNRLVLVGVELDAIIDRVHAGEEVDIAALENLRGQLADIRERDVREMSHLLYPVGVDIGAGHAIRSLVRRIPQTIATEVDIDPQLAADDDLTVDQRVLLVRAAEEAITNALKHGNAGSVRIALTRESDASVRLVVENDGIALLDGGSFGSGLKRLSDGAARLGGALSVDEPESAGARLQLSLPV